jgi:hypothetical protein
VLGTNDTTACGVDMANIPIVKSALESFVVQREWERVLMVASLTATACIPRSGSRGIIAAWYRDVNHDTNVCEKDRKRTSPVFTVSPPLWSLNLTSPFHSHSTPSRNLHSPTPSLRPLLVFQVSGRRYKRA